MIEAFHVQTNSDTTEGRGHMRSYGFFVREQDAHRAAKESNNYDMGGTLLATVTKVKVFESYEDFLDHRQIEARERALSKLTKEDRQVLGL